MPKNGDDCATCFDVCRLASQCAIAIRFYVFVPRQQSPMTRELESNATAQPMSHRGRLPAALRPAHLRTVSRRILPFVATVVVTLLVIFMYDQLRAKPELLSTGDVNTIVTTTMAEATPAPALSAEVYQTILPSLVFIATQGAPPREGGGNIRAQRGQSPAPFAQFAFEQPARGAGTSLLPVQDEVPEGIGSGVVVSNEGAILTALHLVEYADQIFVTFADGTEAQAQIAAVMPDNDIAVLLPDRLPETFAPATLGNPGALRVGDNAYVVGNPLGLSGSISAGVVSGLDRSYTPANRDERFERLIQFDAAVNIGTPGGPLLNRDGEVVGIVVGLVNPTAQETFIGIGFAVRIDQAAAAAGAPEL